MSPVPIWISALVIGGNMRRIRRTIWHWHKEDGEYILTDGRNRMLCCITKCPHSSNHWDIELYQNDDNLEPIGITHVLKKSDIDWVKDRCEQLIIECLWN